MPKPKKPKIIEPYWNDMVGIFFSFTRERFYDTPTFDGSQPRNLKNIIKSLRERAEAKNIEWTYEVATTRFRHFLEHCYMDRWLCENWMLQHLDRNKDKIFYNITRQYLSR